MKRLLYILLLVPFLFSCQFLTPELNTLEGYAEELSDEFLHEPARSFAYGYNPIHCGWTEYVSRTELKYTYVPTSDHTWRCSIIYQPDRAAEKHRMDGDLDAVIDISGWEGRYVLTSCGTILENNGFKTVFQGELRQGGDFWTGYFRVEISKDGKVKDTQEFFYNQRI